MLEIKNYMEEVVFNHMDKVLNNMEICKCEKCRMDIAAIALNNLPTKYVVTQKGELYSKVSTLLSQFEVDAITTITKAAIKINENPQH
ncbi:MAG: late competence development ComFB family protein [Tissierellia bacterium]|nr:late competence development ComFB family protein [Tissierellia bacterium]MDD4726116.1 late competence development ComFB family protein [Tissierellia bacterium]